MLNKRLFPLALALALLVSPVKASGQSLIDPERLTDQQVSYNTAQVQMGSFIKEYNVPAQVHYPLQHALALEENGAFFAEFAVKEGQDVKKGDVLARFTVETSSVTLERLDREIQRLEDETTLGIAQREDSIRVLENTKAEGAEEEKNSILLKKQKMGLEHYQYLQQRSIDSLKQEREAEQKKLSGYTLVAPDDGKVTDFAKIKTGDPVSAGQTLMTLIRTDVVQLRVNNSSGDLRYNMPVKIAVGRENPTVLTGRVVAADGAIPSQERTGIAYISVETDETFQEARITAETIRLDNILVVERSAVVMENGKHYVTKVVDGMLQKRYIGFGMNNLEDVWILHGVAEDDTLLAD